MTSPLRSPLANRTTGMWLASAKDLTERRNAVPIFSMIAGEGIGQPRCPVMNETMTGHLGCPIPSPAIMEKIGTAFRRSVRSFAEANHIPVVRFAKGTRKIDVMRRYVACLLYTSDA